MEQIIQKALEPINKEITTIKLDIAEINKEILAIKLDIAEMKGKIATKDDIIATRQNLGDKMDTPYGVIIGLLIAIIVAILSITFTPFLKRWLENREQARDENRLQRVEAELEALKVIRETEEKRKGTARRIAEEKPEFEEAYRAVGLLNDKKTGGKTS